MPRYELIDGTSKKFWQIVVEGVAFTTTYGRIGTAGQSTTKAFATPESARREHDKLVAEKIRKGYQVVADVSPAEAAPPPPALPPADFPEPSFFGEIVTLAGRIRYPRIGRVDEQDAVFVYLDVSGSSAKLVSRRVRNAFADGPLELGPAVEHWGGEYGFQGGAFDARAGGAFLFEAGYETFLARVDVAGSEQSWRGRAAFELAPADGIFTVVGEGVQQRVMHRTSAGHTVDFGLLPPNVQVSALTATEGGGLVMVSHDRKKARVFVARSGAVKKAATFDAEFGPLRVVRRVGGGAHVAVVARGATRVVALDEHGKIVGAPQDLAHPGQQLSAFAPVPTGFALAAAGGGLEVVISDGAYAARTRAPLATLVHLLEGSGLAANAAGTRLVSAYLLGSEGRVVRLRCAPVDLEQALAEPVAAVAAAPAKVEPPRPPKPGRFGTRDDVVRRVQQRRVLAALGRLFGGRGAEIQASGDARAGSYLAHDGCGNHFMVLWSEAGVVALAFDHDSHLSEWNLPRDMRRPGAHLPRVPSALRALAKRATDHGERLATEGFWIAAGPGGIHGNSEDLDVLKQLEHDEDGEVWMRGGGALSAIASRLAATERAEVTDEERDVLFALVQEEATLEPGAIEQAVKGLAALGVTWPGAVEAARTKKLAESAESSADERLLRAAHDGDLDAVIGALADGADIDCALPAGRLARMKTGATPLQIAMRMRRGRVAEHLIDAGADVNVSLAGPEHPLQIAADDGDILAMRRLLERGSKIPHGALSPLLAPVAKAADEIELIAQGFGREHLVRLDGGKVPEPVDFAFVVRALLDAGARLRSDDRAAAPLRAVVEAGGGADLVPRLTPGFRRRRLRV